jgi:putative transcriptional regulator
MSQLYKDLMNGVSEMEAYMQGNQKGSITHKVHVPEHVDIKEIRSQFHMTQKQFAESFGFALSALQSWESGRRTPEAPARILLAVIAKHPHAVLDATAHG